MFQKEKGKEKEKEKEREREAVLSDMGLDATTANSGEPEGAGKNEGTIRYLFGPGYDRV